MKLSKVLLLLVLLFGGAYMLLNWTGFDQYLASTAVKHVQELQDAANKGEAKDQFQLALAYDRGIGIKNDDAMAWKWYRLAADQGYPMAQYNLGMMYYFGKGVEQDNVKAYQWIVLAAADDLDAATQAMNELAKKIPQQQISAALAAAKAWKLSHNK